MEVKPANADFMAGEHERRYPMVWTPEGYAVHQEEGCTGEAFHGPLGCYHSKENTVTQAVTRYESQVPVRIDFDAEQMKTIASVICTDSNGNVAPAPFVQLFVAACKHTGLDPFLRQIYALNLKGKWTMYVGIDGYRVISERTGLDEGMDGPQWSDDGQTWFDFPPEDAESKAKYCRVGIWRKGVPRPFVAVVSMATKINPTSQSWKDDPNGMLAKCAEALARRRAFPADMAVLPNDVAFSAEDFDGTPVTRAEVPEGQYREIAQEAPVAAPERPQQASTHATPPEALATVPALLSAIETQHGIGAKQAAISTMQRLFDTMSPTKLTQDERAEFIPILRLRLDMTPHEHELSYTPRGVAVCHLCGSEMVPEGETNEEREPVAQGLPI